LKSIYEELQHNLSHKIESIGFVFSETTKQPIIELRNTFKNSIKMIGCSGISHGLNAKNSSQSENIFFKRGKCVLLVIQLNKEL